MCLKSRFASKRVDQTFDLKLVPVVYKSRLAHRCSSRTAVRKPHLRFLYRCLRAFFQSKCHKRSLNDWHFSCSDFAALDLIADHNVPGERIGNRRTAKRAVWIQTVPLSDGEQSGIGFPPRPLTRNCGRTGQPVPRGHCAWPCEISEAGVLKVVADPVQDTGWKPMLSWDTG